MWGGLSIHLSKKPTLLIPSAYEMIRSMQRTNPVITRSINHFAKMLDLIPYSDQEINVRKKLCSKIIDVIRRKNLSCLKVAELAHTYPTNISSILNGRSNDISTHLMLRILVALGIRAKMN